MIRRDSAVVDANALQELTDDSASRCGFTQWLERSQSVCYLSDIAVQEVIPDRDPRRSSERLFALQQLALQIHPAQLRYAASHEHAIRRELEEPQSGVVELDPEFLTRLRSASYLSLSTASVEAQVILDHISAKKADLYETDRNLADNAVATVRDWKVPTAEEVVQVIRSHSRLLPSDLWIDIAAQWSSGRWASEQLAADPSRFPILHAMGHLTLRQNLANLVPRDPPPSAEYEQVLGTFRTKAAKKGGRGAWYDNAIAASAVNATWLVTNDSNLRRRCDELQRQGLYRCKAIALDDLLKV